MAAYFNIPHCAKHFIEWIYNYIAFLLLGGSVLCVCVFVLSVFINNAVATYVGTHTFL